MCEAQTEIVWRGHAMQTDTEQQYRISVELLPPPESRQHLSAMRLD